ncbi:MAG: hypothetical protein HZB55_02435 [Deltaproteobacteria bacterium]|nr:hypothetical protein [Deltaproteobacteria bacterium]
MTLFSPDRMYSDDLLREKPMGLSRSSGKTVHGSKFWSQLAAFLTVAIAIWFPEASSADSALQKALTGRLGDDLRSFQLWDAANRDGKGFSDAKTGGDLGWGESAFLRNYVLCYTVTRDTYWLDKIVDHFDRMKNAAAPDDQGFLGWRDARYSVGVVKVEPVGPTASLDVTPAVQRTWVGEGGEKVSGHDYLIEFTSDTSLEVRDLTTTQAVGNHQHTGSTEIREVPAASFTIKGSGKKGAKFRVVTIAPKELQLQVLDGMISYPIGQFVAIALSDPSLARRYGEKAREYAAFIERNVFEKWERTWTTLSDGTGVYRFTDDPTQRFPGYGLPHNQYLALARTWLVLKDVPGLSHRADFADRATRMAQRFQSKLRRRGQAYVWNYWDPLPGEKVPDWVEDQSHATVDVSFALEAAERRIVFNEDDLRHFAATYSDVMWNGSLAHPRFGDRVDTPGGETLVWTEWIGLGRVSNRVCDIAAAMSLESDRPPAMIPQLLDLYRRVVGFSESDRRTLSGVTTKVTQTLSPASGLPNPGFEEGTPATAGPVGWRLTIWSPGKGGTATWVTEAHSGEKAIALTGTTDASNVVALPVRNISPVPARKPLVTVFYRTIGDARPTLSLLGFDGRRKRVQYDTSPPLPAITTWQLYRWAPALSPDVVEFSVVLRSTGVGTTYYDDLALAWE